MFQDNFSFFYILVNHFFKHSYHIHYSILYFFTLVKYFIYLFYLLFFSYFFQCTAFLYFSYLNIKNKRISVSFFYFMKQLARGPNVIALSPKHDKVNHNHKFCFTYDFFFFFPVCDFLQLLQETDKSR